MYNHINDLYEKYEELKKEIEQLKPQNPPDHDYDYHYSGVIQKDWELELSRNRWEKTIVAGLKIGDPGTAKVYRSKKVKQQTFKASDLIVCIDDICSCNVLKEGKIYVVEKVFGEELKCVGFSGNWYINRFRHAEPAENEKIDNFKRSAMLI